MAHMVPPHLIADELLRNHTLSHGCPQQTEKEAFLIRIRMALVMPSSWSNGCRRCRRSEAGLARWRCYGVGSHSTLTVLSARG